MNVTYYLKLTKKCRVTGLDLVSVKTDKEGDVMILNDAYDAMMAVANLNDELMESGDFETEVTQSRLVDEYAVPS